MTTARIREPVAAVGAEHDGVHAFLAPLLTAAAAVLLLAVAIAAGDAGAAASALRDQAAVAGALPGVVLGLRAGAPGAAADVGAALLHPRRTAIVPRRAAVAGLLAAALALPLVVLSGGVFALTRAATGDAVPGLGTIASAWWVAPWAALAAGTAACGLAALVGRAAALGVVVGVLGAAWLAQELAASTGGASPVDALLGALGPGGPDGTIPAAVVAVLLLLPGLLLVAGATVRLRRRPLSLDGSRP